MRGAALAIGVGLCLAIMPGGLLALGAYTLLRRWVFRPDPSLVIVESPYAGNTERNERYARACLRDCLLRGESPFASHLLYTQTGVLNDALKTERMRGIVSGLAWGRVAARTVVYTDLGVSAGMQQGIDAAKSVGRPVEYRSLPDGVLI